MASFATTLTKSAEGVNAGDMEQLKATLTGQAVTLNSMFGKLSCKAAANMDSIPEASEGYLCMALRAQNQCRMTLETLINIKNPPVVYAKQANGPQQVNNATTFA
jgi:hypothetical protein